MRKPRLHALAVIVLFLTGLVPALSGEFREDHTLKPESVSAVKNTHVKTSIKFTSSSTGNNTGISNQITIISPDLRFPETTSIAALKYLPDNTPVCVSQKSVSWLSGFTFYIEEADRSAAIRAEVPDGSLTPSYIGSIISFSGVLKTDAERYIEVNSSTLMEHAITPAIPCLGMANIRVAGKPLNGYTPGLPNSIHSFNVGLFAKTWGWVTHRDRADQHGTVIYIDDGSKIRDGSHWYGEPNLGLRIHYDGDIPQVGQFVTVAGVTSLEWWDPTLADPTNGDSFLVPSVRTCNSEDLTVISENAPPVPPPSIGHQSVSGHVTVFGEPESDMQIRVYSLYSSKILNCPTSAGVNYTLPMVPVTGALITANSPGYKSATIYAVPGQPAPELVLEPYGQLSIDVSSNTSVIKLCNDETAIIKALLRDCEGQGIKNKSVKFTASKGTFVESGTAEYISTTNSSGVVSVHLRTSPDSEGITHITATDYPNASTSDQVDVEFRGRRVEATANPSYITSAGTSVVKAVVYDAELNPLPGAEVFFKTDSGGFTESGGAATRSAITDSQGEATATLDLSSPCTATVTVRTEDTCGNQAISWVVVAYRGTPFKEKGTGFSSPLLANLDNSTDGTKEIAILCTDQKLHVWKCDGTLLWEVGEDFSQGANNTPSAANIDNDPAGTLEVVIPHDLQRRVHAYAGATGLPLAGWPTITNFPFTHIAATLADINRDGALEVIAGDECCFVFSWNSSGNWEAKDTPQSSFLWRNLTGSTGTVIFGSTCAVGDMDNDPDAMPDVLVGTNSSDYYAFPGNAWGDFTCTTGPGTCGTGIYSPLPLYDWPVTTPSWAQSSPAIGDLDGDGRNDNVIMCDRGYLMMYLSETGQWINVKLSEAPASGPEQPDSAEPSPVLADLNNDGYVDLIAAISEGKVFVFDGKIIADEHRLKALSGWEGGLKVNLTGNYEIRSSPAVGDINDDNELEVVVGCSDGNLYALYSNGMKHVDSQGNKTGAVAWARCCIPSNMPTASVYSSPAIDDIDADGKVEVVVGSTGGIWVFDFDAVYHSDRMPWPTYHHDNGRTGCITTPPGPKYGAIIGRLTRNGTSVIGYDVKIEYNNGNVVLQPTSNPLNPQYPTPARTRVMTSGSTSLNDTTQSNRGIYCINQLNAGYTYKISFGPKGFTVPEKVVTNVLIPAEGGVVRLDITLP